MTSAAALVIRPQSPLDAYSQIDRGGDADGDFGSFGSVMKRAMQEVVSTGQDAEVKSMNAIAGKGDITDVVAAVSKADLALQTTVAIRDRMVQAYQTVMNMTI